MTTAGGGRSGCEGRTNGLPPGWAGDVAPTVRTGKLLYAGRTQQPHGRFLILEQGGAVH